MGVKNIMGDDHICAMPIAEHPLIIKKERTAFLEGCLKAFLKDQLLFLAENLISEDPAFFTYTKEKLVSALGAAIRKRISYAFKYLPPQASAFFLALASENEDDIAASEETVKKIFTKNLPGIEYEDLKRDAVECLIENGFCFAFLPKGQNRIQYVVPDELYESIDNFINDIGKRKMPPGELYPFMRLGSIFASLYGVCPADLYMKLYNRDAPSAITDKRLFVKCMKEAASLSKDYYFKNDSIVSIFIGSDEEIASICDRRKKFTPYIPEIEELTGKLDFGDYDEDKAAYKALVSWYSDFFKDTDKGHIMALSICAHIKIGYPPAKTIMDSFSNEESSTLLKENVQQLLQIVSDFNNTCHLWTNWGHPPSELRDTRAQGKSDAFLTPEAVEEKNRRINSVHIDLPETCRNPSKDECERQLELFTAYWKHEDGAPWHDTTSAQIKKLYASLKKYARFFRNLPEDLVPRLIDQWLASVWHKDANRGSPFGNQRWNYHAFRPIEKIGEDVFACIDGDGEVLVIYSHGIGTQFGSTLTNMCVLIDAGGWYLTYGPILTWNGIVPSDFAYLAEHIARRQYELQGLTAVIHFDPCPFWAVQTIAQLPPIFHKDEFVMLCSLECKFKNNIVPKLPKTWTVEHAEKYTRWIYNEDDYLNARRIYFNEKTNEVYLSAHNEDAFEKMLTRLKGSIDIGSHKIERVSMAMESLCSDLLKTPQKLALLEAKFGDGV